MDIKIINQPGYEKVAEAHDAETGLRAVIAVHSTHRGPSLGGVRMFPYSNKQAALADVLRLARAMTYKSASVDLKLGGGKAVIVGDPLKDKTPELFKRMGEFIHTFQGTYYSAKDAGIVTADLVEVSKTTPYVKGLPSGSGDPSYLTACGIIAGMRTALKFKLGIQSFYGIHVAVQGLGHVGYAVAKLLHFEDANLTVTDMHSALAKKVANELGARVVEPDQIFDVPADIFSPCAMGSILNAETIRKLRSSIIAGAANNQLSDEKENGDQLHQRGILYVPDYMINAGGVINIYVRDILKQTHPERWLVKIEENLQNVFELSKSKNISTARTANELTEIKLGQP